MPPEFTISVQKESGRPSGLLIDILDPEHAFICAVTDGPFERYNLSVGQGLQVRPGDYIVEVNGTRGHLDQAIAAMVSLSSLKCVVQRAKEFEITIDKNGGALGLDVITKA